MEPAAVDAEKLSEESEEAVRRVRNLIARLEADLERSGRAVEQQLSDAKPAHW